MPPTWNNNGWSQGTSSAAFLKGANWGIYEGRLATGVLKHCSHTHRSADRYGRHADGLVLMGSPFLPRDSRSVFRGLVMAPDNSLYVAVDEGEIYQDSDKHAVIKLHLLLFYTFEEPLVRFFVL